MQQRFAYGRDNRNQFPFEPALGETVSMTRPANPAIRPAEDRDTDRITAIYAHHVLTGLGTFELEPPDAAEIRRRRDEVTTQGLPFLVAERDGTVIGYAYAGPYRPRPAYRFTVENSIYLAPESAGQGVGRQLLAELVRRCEALHLKQMVAVIGDSGNAASIAVHRGAGFEMVGILRQVGFKHGRWVDTVLMQRGLGGGRTQ
jgi:L-amino acid N-acyltransferase YncA